ncbi:MerR family transcriptional regulator [Massilia sp. Mn16-1_5]|uniref:MerR family transcriptional regulator n=1 Tax=Massilia sp. Mn16-1_5 TaxID=2079199 RepID=UPI00109EAB73|nr:MerR family transcriptional regulator [Massilia sp. Mn16-1_5]THC44967.1 MerR family transcriptional regulator [Massilia sp. Mn16-1_5]
MFANQIVTGVLIDDVALDMEELARACQVEPDWVVRHVQAGVLGELTLQTAALRFRSTDLARARRLLELERHFDANEELAALVIDLADEVRRLRARLHALGIRDT